MPQVKVAFYPEEGIEDLLKTRDRCLGTTSSVQRQELADTTKNLDLGDHTMFLLEETYSIV